MTSPRSFTRAAALVAASMVAASLAGCDAAGTPNADAPPASQATKADADKPVPSGVDWKPYKEGLAEAKSSDRPVCLIFYTDWCPHCQNYKKVFENPDVVALSRKFVMIRINKDQDPQTSAQYAPDGEYIPRTFFLNSDGTLLPQITAKRDKYKYFYDEHDPASVLSSMRDVASISAAG
jgi:protein-disulfide reductase (glutathione)